MKLPATIEAIIARVRPKRGEPDKAPKFITGKACISDGLVEASRQFMTDSLGTVAVLLLDAKSTDRSVTRRGSLAP